MRKIFQKVLDTFFGQFSSTIELAEELIAERKHPQEILLLLCGRLDALASSSAREGEPSGKSFARFVTDYGQRRRLFESVSMGDLYYEVAFHQWLLPGTIEKPGRLYRFSEVHDGILSLLTESDIPLTQQEADRMLAKILKTLRHHFRVAPRQSRKKQTAGTMPHVIETIVNGLKKKKESAESIATLRRALRPLLDSKVIARILYERFRCEVIHGGSVSINEGRFFDETEPYWNPWYSGYYGSFMHIEFPARWLVALMRDCIQGFRRHLTARGKLPLGIVFDGLEGDLMEHAELVDEDFVGNGGPVKFNLPRH